MSKKNNSHKIVRKLGEREEIIEHRLTDDEIQLVQETVMALLDQRQEVEEKKKEANANFKAQLETIELQLETARRTYRGGVRKDTVVIEEHLTAANEVIRIRKGTGQVIGQRTATAAELQEEMFPEGEEESGEVPQDEAPSESNGEDEAGFAFGGEPA